MAAGIEAAAAPYRPEDDVQVLERLLTAVSKTARQLHAELSQAPQNLALALRVARRDIEVARSEGDPRYNGYAEAALGPWLKLPNPPVNVVVLRATLRQARHDFSPALADLSRVLVAIRAMHRPGSRAPSFCRSKVITQRHSAIAYRWHNLPRVWRRRSASTAFLAERTSRGQH